VTEEEDNIYMEVANLSMEVAKLTKERDELAKAFVAAYDELEDYYCAWCRRQSAMPKEVQSFVGLREKLRAKEGASDE
jgi:hypothetical protein